LGEPNKTVNADKMEPRSILPVIVTVRRQNNMNKKNTDKRIAIFINKGSEIAGAATGGAIGFLAGGPAGAAFGAAMGPIVKTSLQTIGDVAQRILSHREIIRVAGVSALAIDNIRQRLEKGEQPRDDDFFQPRKGALPKAVELFEGVLLKSKSEHEEKKIPFFANLFSSVCFRQDVSSDEGNWFVQLLERLNYRHLNILYAFYEMGDQSPWQWNMIYKLAIDHSIMVAQIEELKANSLLSQSFWGDSPVKITELGVKFIELVGFEQVVDHTYETVAVILRSNRSDA
jgi:predicted transcriptional regulator